MTDAPPQAPPRVAVLCGGVGAARFLRGLLAESKASAVTAIVNTADDMVLHGLAISPDLDTCTYTLAEAINPDTGWGLAGETWQARETLDRYGGQTWFALGDRDLGTHLYRTQRLSEGASLSQVTAEIAAAWGLGLTIVPMTDDPVRTRVTTSDGEVLDFQRYFVERQHRDHIVEVAFDGAERATPAPGVIDALTCADVIVIAPSNPFVSIGPILALPGLRTTLARHRERVVCISPIVGGAAVKGPAADLMSTLGHDVSALGVARIFADVAAHMVIDETDAKLAGAVEAIGVHAHITDTMMVDIEIARRLATCAIETVQPTTRS